MIVTSNKPFSAWGEIFGDEVVAAAMIDRLVHHAEILAPTVGAGLSARDALDLEVESVIIAVDHAHHPQPGEAEQSASFVRHPSSSLLRVLINAKPGKGGGCLRLRPQPRSFSKTPVFDRWKWVRFQALTTDARNILAVRDRSLSRDGHCAHTLCVAAGCSVKISM